jgi:hypothetical protein
LLFGDGDVGENAQIFMICFLQLGLKKLRSMLRAARHWCRRHARASRPADGWMLAKWIGAQVKTTEPCRYSNKDETGFDYLLRSEDLEYWRDANIPVIIVLVRVGGNEMYWKEVDSGAAQPSHVVCALARQSDKKAADRIAALCIARQARYLRPANAVRGSCAHQHAQLANGLAR